MEKPNTVDDLDGRPVKSLNLLLKIGENGHIAEAVTLPDAVNELQERFGFEGVITSGVGENELVFVAFQREWADDLDDRVRIGCYNPSKGTWSFVYYPIKFPLSPNGGWVGISEIVALGNDGFAVIERDNQGGRMLGLNESTVLLHPRIFSYPKKKESITLRWWRKNWFVT